LEEENEEWYEDEDETRPKFSIRISTIASLLRWTLGILLSCSLGQFSMESLQDYQEKKLKETILSESGTLVGHDRKETHQPFLDAYNRNGGAEKLGSPNSFVEKNRNLNWVRCEPHQHNCFPEIQKFSGGSEGKGVIVKSSYDSQAYWVGGAFWAAFDQINRGPLTIEPISDRKPNRKWSIQRFSSEGEASGCGAIFQVSTRVFYTSGEIGCHYFYKENGEKGPLGIPTSNPQKVGADTVQYFENGCIVRNIAWFRLSLKSITPLKDCPTSLFSGQ
jgi:hypothetical protein